MHAWPAWRRWRPSATGRPSGAASATRAGARWAWKSATGGPAGGSGDGEFELLEKTLEVRLKFVRTMALLLQQGAVLACQAAEDAVVLARCVEQAPTIEAAFAAYDMPAVHTIGWNVLTNRPKEAAYRAPGAPISSACSASHWTAARPSSAAAGKRTSGAWR